jgi:hypothetical protein
MAEAGAIITITQSGSDVVATGSGTINTAALVFQGPVFFPGTGFPSDPLVLLGPTMSTNLIILWTVTSGPSTLGPGGLTDATSGSGSNFGTFEKTFIGLPGGYVSGSSLSATDTWANQTFATLGLTPGTYTWSWGSGATADTLVVQVGSASVPEPSGLVLSGLALLSLGVFGFTRHRLRRCAA